MRQIKDLTVLPPGANFSSDLPARLDRLPWSPWHWRLITSLGIAWLLDGLEVTVVGSVASVLVEPATLHLTETQIGAIASFYLLGAVLGALVFGRWTDRFGRKKLFLVTLTIYILGTLLTAFSWNFETFAFCRALTGAGIGGESSAVNSAIDELIPARIRGRINLGLNGSYWLGTALGALISLVFLNPRLFPLKLGWRLTFVLGAVLGCGVFLLRRHLPESPRWLLLHGRLHDAKTVVHAIENQVIESKGEIQGAPPIRTRHKVKGTITFGEIGRLIFFHHRKRAILGLVLMSTQAFAYNAIFFTYALVLGRFYGVSSDRIGLYLLPFAIGNFLGPLLLGKFFDTLGRRIMITATYGTAGILLAITGYSFAQGWLTAESQTALWCAVFFVASAAASSAYLTVSELFPVEMRGMAIALFYAIGTGVGGIGAPALLGALIQTGDRTKVAEGYFIGAGLMIFAAMVAAILGVPAEGKSLETLSELESPPHFSAK